MNFEKDSVPVLVAELKDNSGNTLKIAMTQLEEDEEFELQTLHPASRLNSKPGAQLSTFWGWTVGPRTVGPPDSWAPDSWAPGQLGPGQLGPGQLGPGTFGPRTVRPWSNV